MNTMDFTEAQKRFLELLDRVQQGEHFAICKEGIPVALMVPAEKPKPSPENIAQVIEQLKEFRKGNTLGGLSLREMIEEGRA